ncbi:MAG: rhodanese-like domain-containing protein [Desulfuromonadales bacterium]
MNRSYRAAGFVSLLILIIVVIGGCSSEVPYSNASFEDLNTEVGCASNSSDYMKEGIFRSRYENHRMIWSGVVVRAQADKVSLNIDGKGTQDLQVNFANSLAGYTLEKGSFITVSFVMKKMGNCSLPFFGEKATIESTVYTSYSPAQTFELIKQRKGLLIIDVRSPEELREGKIKNSLLIPLVDIMTGNYNIPRGRPLLLYCATGGRSYAAMQILARNGYMEIYNLQGGISAWKEANLPLVY